VIGNFSFDRVIGNFSFDRVIGNFSFDRVIGKQTSSKSRENIERRGKKSYQI